MPGPNALRTQDPLPPVAGNMDLMGMLDGPVRTVHQPELTDEREPFANAISQMLASYSCKVTVSCPESPGTGSVRGDSSRFKKCKDKFNAKQSL